MPIPPNLHSRLRTDSCLFSSNKFWGRVIFVQNLLDASESNVFVYIDSCLVETGYSSINKIFCLAWGRNKGREKILWVLRADKTYPLFFSNKGNRTEESGTWIVTRALYSSWTVEGELECPWESQDLKAIHWCRDVSKANPLTYDLEQDSKTLTKI